MRLGLAIGKRILPRLKNFKYAGKSGPRAPAESPPSACAAPHWGYWAQTGPLLVGAQRQSMGERSQRVAAWQGWGHGDRGEASETFPPTIRNAIGMARQIPRDTSERHVPCKTAPMPPLPSPPPHRATVTVLPCFPWGSGDGGRAG